jgi:hypothetical protein
MIVFSILSGLMVATLLMVNIYIVKGLAEIDDEETTSEVVVIPTTPPSIPVLTIPTVVEKPKRKKKDVKDSGNS